MKIQTITVQNIKSIDYKSVDFKGCTAVVMGGNNKGKTTLLRSLYDRIVSKGMNGALRQGEGEGSSEYQFTDGSSLRREINAKGTERFIYTDAQGIVKKTGVIKEIAGKIFGTGFEIDKFLELTPKDQSKELERILKIDLSEINNQYTIAYEQRREAKNELKQYDPFISKRDTEGYIDITDLRIDLEKKQQSNKEAEEYNRGLDEKTKELETKTEIIMGTVDSLAQEKEKLLLRIQEIDTTSERLTAEMKELAKEYGEVATTTKKETIEVDFSKLEEAMDNNKTIEANMQHNERYEKRIAIQKKVDELEKVCNNLTKEREDIIAHSPVPEGFKFTDDGLYYNGFPLDKRSLSTSALYIASLKLASLAKGELDTQFFDASYLDKESIEQVLIRAKENGDLQLLIERPLYEGGEIQYELIDGETEKLEKTQVQPQVNVVPTIEEDDDDIF